MEVAIYLLRSDWMALVVVIQILKKMVPFKLLTLQHYSDYAPVIDSDLMLDATFALEFQHGAALVDEGKVALAQGGQPKAVVITRVGEVADANAGGIE